MTDADLTTIPSFYYRDDISRSTHPPKRELLYTPKDVYLLFLRHHPDISVEFSSFSKLRPAEVETGLTYDPVWCACCENFAALVKAKAYHSKRKVCLQQWRKGVMKTYNWGPQKLQDEMRKQSATCFKHMYNVSRQTTAFQNQLHELKPDALLMEIGFSPVSKTIHPDIVLYTAVLYFRHEDRLETKSYAVISSTYRDIAMVHLFNRHILQDFFSNQTHSYKTLIVWSSGSSSHFKNTYSMAVMFLSPIFVEWNFFAPYHDAYRHDGVGAQLKHHVWRKILLEKVIMNSAQDFFDASKDTDMCRCLFVDASKKSIQSELGEMKEFFLKMNKLYGTSYCHCIKKSGFLSVDIYRNTGDAVPYKGDLWLKKIKKIHFLNLKIFPFDPFNETIEKKSRKRKYQKKSKEMGDIEQEVKKNNRKTVLLE